MPLRLSVLRVLILYRQKAGDLTMNVITEFDLAVLDWIQQHLACKALGCIICKAEEMLSEHSGRL